MKSLAARCEIKNGDNILRRSAVASRLDPVLWLLRRARKLLLQIPFHLGNREREERPIVLSDSPIEMRTVMIPGLESDPESDFGSFGAADYADSGSC